MASTGPRCRIDEEACCEGQEQVAVGDAAGEERMVLRRLLAHMRIEGVAGEFREVLDVLERDRALLRDEGLADREILEVVAEGMAFLFDDRARP